MRFQYSAVELFWQIYRCCNTAWIYNNSTFIFTAYYLSRCARNDPEINTCLKNSANRLAKFLRQGIAELGIDEVCCCCFYFRLIFDRWHRFRPQNFYVYVFIQFKLEQKKKWLVQVIKNDLELILYFWIIKNHKKHKISMKSKCL